MIELNFHLLGINFLLMIIYRNSLESFPFVGVDPISIQRLLIQSSLIFDYYFAMYEMARPNGFEPLTDRLEGDCSIQLSYGRLLQRFILYYKV